MYVCNFLELFSSSFGISSNARAVHGPGPMNTVRPFKKMNEDRTERYDEIGISMPQ